MERQSYSLYNGAVTLEFDPVKHRYKAIEQLGDSLVTVYPPSITTVLGVINKPALVQWAVNQAIDSLRQQLTEGDHSPDDVERYLDLAKYAHKARKEEAAAVGTIAHDWLENYWLAILEGRTHDQPMPENPLARNCVSAALDWISQHDIQPILVERPLYSRIHKVAGKMDKLARIDGKLAVLDWKSSTGLWPENQFQTAAYAKMYQEETGEEPEVRVLVKLGKYDGNFDSKTFDRPSAEEDFKAFLGALAVQRRLAELNPNPRR